MRRRTFVTAMLVTAAAPGAARAQINLGAATAPQPSPDGADPDANAPRISPQNELERAFLGAYSDLSQRAAFPRVLLRSQVAVAMVSDAPDAGPIMVTTSLERGAESCVAMYTSPERLSAALSGTLPAQSSGAPAAPPVQLLLSGREALTRYRVRNIALNEGCPAPTLILHPSDIERYLAMSDAG